MKDPKEEDVTQSGEKEQTSEGNEPIRAPQVFDEGVVLTTKAIQGGS